MRRDRPGKRVSANSAPAGTPSRRLSTVALRETRSERRTIAQTSRSPLANKRLAASSPLQRSSMARYSSCRRGGHGLDAAAVVGTRREGRLPELLYPELANELLCRRIEQEGREGLTARDIDVWTIGRVEGDDVIDVDERLVTFDQNWQLEPVA